MLFRFGIGYYYLNSMLSGIVMRKPLIFLLLISGVILQGCSNQYVPMPNLVHKIDIQQGNVLTQEQINQLKPGMSRSQVQYILGTAPISDTFHQDRLDYIYLYKKGRTDEVERRRISLYFSDDTLVGLQGDFRPEDEPDEGLTKKEAFVDVPKERKEEGFVKRMWDKITSDDEEEAFKP
jgi:outer membrane protein assembly factor BamE